jgi:hypothetical protein
MENVTGYGIPRYNYVDSVENGSVQAQVVLPDMRVFTGNYALTRPQVSGIIRLVFYCATHSFWVQRIGSWFSHLHSQSINVLSRIWGFHNGNYVKFYLAHTHTHTHVRAPVAWVRKRTIPTERPPLSAKLVPTLADRGCHMVSMTDPYCRILDF